MKIVTETKKTPEMNYLHNVIVVEQGRRIDTVNESGGNTYHEILPGEQEVVCQYENIPSIELIPQEEIKINKMRDTTLVKRVDVNEFENTINENQNKSLDVPVTESVDTEECVQDSFPQPIQLVPIEFYWQQNEYKK
jgi:hypothetical protein